MLQLSSAPVRPSLLLPSLAAIVAIGIFVVDTVTPLDIAIAVLYVAVVLLAMDFAGRNGILIVAGGCAAAHRAELRHHPRARSGKRPLSALPHQPGGDRHHRRSCRAPSGHDRGAARACEPARPHARHDLRARQMTSSPTGTAAPKSSTAGGGAGGRAKAPTAADGLPGAARRHHGGADAHRALGRRAGPHEARRQRLVVASRWALQRDQRGRPVAILETNNDITERNARPRRPAAGPGRARPRRARDHPRRARRLDRARGQPAAGRHRHQRRGLPALARARRPDIDQARSAVERMIRDGQRASEVVRRLRAPVAKGDPARRPLDRQRRRRARWRCWSARDLQPSRDLQRSTCAGGLPPVRGDRVQLQQVIINC